MAASQTRLPKDQLRKAIPPHLLVASLLHVGWPKTSPSGAGHKYDPDMLTIPGIASSFGADQTAAIASRTKIVAKMKGEFDGGSRGKDLAPNLP
jgi:hypothetical protein